MLIKMLFLIRHSKFTIILIPVGEINNAPSSFLRTPLHTRGLYQNDAVTGFLVHLRCVVAGWSLDLHFTFGL